MSLIVIAWVVNKTSYFDNALSYLLCYAKAFRLEITRTILVPLPSASVVRTSI